MRRAVLFIVVCVGLLGTSETRGGEFSPDPKSVQRHGAGYRYPQAGWIVLHIEGTPHERGYQHGKLLAPEIAAYVRCLAAVYSPKAPTESWSVVRQIVNALFLRRFEREYLEEMKGIADGAAAAGARFDGRPVDLTDIVALNMLPELETLPSALEATATGLEGMKFPGAQPRVAPPPKPMHCTAFAATGPATADGKIVFGHITMFSLYPSSHFNVWLDVKPAKGHRVLMQTYPGGIQSGLDYYLNDAGLIVCETTIRQTRFDIQGQTLASRIRQALQYADSIDRAVEILKNGNNGLYTNEWLLADTKTNEIAMFELGTHKTRLYRSSKNDWFGGTEGFYWGCNNTKDLDVRLETVASVEGRPANAVWRPSPRDQKWLQLYQQHKGKIDASFGKLAFTTPPLAAYHSLDAKFTTTDMARELKTWALFGPPLGKTWQPTEDEKQKYPEVRPLASNPWTILHTQTPPAREKVEIAVRDLPEPALPTEMKEKDRTPPTEPAWHGTLLPRSDSDTWLAAGFADFEKIVALDKALDAKKKEDDKKRSPNDRVSLELFGQRSSYLAAARATRDVPLMSTRAELNQAHWYRLASGKGVCLLQTLRQLLGEEVFDDMMDAFGRAHAGQQVSATEFQTHVTQWAGKHGKEALTAKFFDQWLKQPGLPRLRLDGVVFKAQQPGWTVEGVLLRENGSAPIAVEIELETAHDPVRKTLVLKGPRTEFSLQSTLIPRRLVVDPRCLTPKLNGGIYSTASFYNEMEQTLIVYGTTDELATNRAAAEALQRALIERGPNITVAIRSDKEISADELKSHLLLLIGRPDSNALVDRFRAALPGSFGSRSFTVGRDSYAHAGSAVIMAGENPLQPRYSVVVIAGLSGAATLQAAPKLPRTVQHPGEVLLLPNRSRPQALVVPARELVQKLDVKPERP